MDQFVGWRVPMNQLQFNLNPLPGQPGLPARIRPPQPIIIEKYGHIPHSGQMLPRQYSYISKDSMSEAIQAAKQDLQQRKNGEIVHERNARAKSPKMVAKDGRTKLVNSAEYLYRMHRRHQQNVPKLLIKERSVTQPVKNVVTQTFQPNISPVDLPVRSMSPPTRDMTHEDKMMAEINRLRVEITKCLQQIKQIESQHPQLTGTREEDASERLRRIVRAEEQSTRLARIIYSLNKQISQLQEELRRNDLKTLSPNKKSQFVSRLASLHRAVVRALQISVRHVSDADVCPNVLTSCRELAAVIRQLSLCYAQLEVVSDTSQPDIILSLINDIVALSKIAESGCASTSLPKSSNESRTRNQQPSYSRTEKFVWTQSAAPMEHRFSNDGRQSELRAGIQQLLRPKDKTAAVHVPARKKISKSSRSRPRNRSVLIERPGQSQPVADHDEATRPYAHYAESTYSKALKEQSKYQRAENLTDSRDWRPSETSFRSAVDRDEVAQPNAHYAEQTFSKALKEQGKFLRAEKLTSSRERKQSDTSVLSGTHQSPRHRSRSLSPSRSCGCLRHGYSLPQRSQSVSERPYLSPLSSPRSNWRLQGNVSSSSTDLTLAHRRNETVRRIPEVTRRAWQYNNYEGSPQRDARIRSPQRQLSENVFWRPIDPAVDSHPHSSKQRFTNQGNLESVLDQSQEQINRSQVSQSVLNDLVSDVSRELYQNRVDNIVDRQSAYLRDVPSVTTLLQRLQDMEMEQDAIRQRWSTIVYDDSGAIDANIDVAQHVTHSGRVSGDNMIVFTKPVLGTDHRERLVLGSHPRFDNEVADDRHSRRSTELRVRISSETVARIEQNVKNYEEFLQRRYHNVSSKYNPWMALDHIAENILTGCIEDVVNELDQINNEIVDTVYGAEFSVAH